MFKVFCNADYYRFLYYRFLIIVFTLLKCLYSKGCHMLIHRDRCDYLYCVFKVLRKGHRVHFAISFFLGGGLVAILYSISVYCINFEVCLVDSFTHKTYKKTPILFFRWCLLKKYASLLLLGQFWQPSWICPIKYQIN